MGLAVDPMSSGGPFGPRLARPRLELGRRESRFGSRGGFGGRGLCLRSGRLLEVNFLGVLKGKASLRTVAMLILTVMRHTASFFTRLRRGHNLQGAWLAYMAIAYLPMAYGDHSERRVSQGTVHFSSSTLIVIRRELRT